MSERARSEQACPVCGQHTLALDQPPEIDVMGVQAYSEVDPGVEIGASSEDVGAPDEVEPLDDGDGE